MPRQRPNDVGSVEKGATDGVQYYLKSAPLNTQKAKDARNTMTLNNYMTFGVSISGRVSLQHPEDVKHLKLVSSVRFSPPFHRALNYKATKNYLSVGSAVSV